VTDECARLMHSQRETLKATGGKTSISLTFLSAPLPQTSVRVNLSNFSRL